MAETLEDSTLYSEKILSELKDRRDICIESLNSIEGINVPKPDSTFYLFPNITSVMESKDCNDLDAFRIKALKATGVSFCTRNHFGKPKNNETDQYIRLAYSGINNSDIKEGLALLKAWIEE